MDDKEISAIKAEAWERGFMYAFAQERGHGGIDMHAMEVPSYLYWNIQAWNPHIDYDEEEGPW